MGSPSGNLSLRVSGRLAHSCTDLTADWPHGGVGMGLVGKVSFNPPSRYAVTEREEDGSVGSVIYTGGRTAAGIELLSWDPDALAVAFQSTTNYAEGRLLEFPGTGTLAGQNMPAVSNLVFTPRDYKGDAEHPAWCIYNAVPMLETNQRLLFSSYRVLSVMIAFVGKEDSNGRVAAVGPLSRIPGVS